MDVVVRNEMADRTKPGDKCVFTGTLIAVPDLAQLRSGHDHPELTRETGGQSSYATEGLTGLHALGELSCCLNFLAWAVHLADANGEPPHHRRCHRCRHRRRRRHPPVVPPLPRPRIPRTARPRGASGRSEGRLLGRREGGGKGKRDGGGRGGRRDGGRREMK